MIKITDIAAEVRRIAEAHPHETFYDVAHRVVGHAVDCAYQINLEPACIVGRALSNLGVSGLDLAKFDAEPISTFGYIAANPMFDVDDQDELDFILRMQGRQDMDMQWGTALEREAEEL